MTIDLYCQRCVDYVDILLGVPPLGGYNHNTVGKNGDFQPLHAKISRNSQTVSNAATVTINHQLEICCRFLRCGPSYTHCCRALTFASARLSCCDT